MATLNDARDVAAFAEELYGDDDVVGYGMSHDGKDWYVRVYALPDSGAHKNMPEMINDVRIVVVETGEFHLD